MTSRKKAKKKAKKRKDSPQTRVSQRKWKKKRVARDSESDASDASDDKSHKRGASLRKKRAPSPSPDDDDQDESTNSSNNKQRPRSNKLKDDAHKKSKTTSDVEDSPPERGDDQKKRRKLPSPTARSRRRGHRNSRSKVCKFYKFVEICRICMNHHMICLQSTSKSEDDENNLTAQPAAQPRKPMSFMRGTVPRMLRRRLTTMTAKKTWTARRASSAQPLKARFSNADFRVWSTASSSSLSSGDHHVCTATGLIGDSQHLTLTGGGEERDIRYSRNSNSM